MATTKAWAFLIDRTMVVKIGTELSEPRIITGGAVQGLVLGILDQSVPISEHEQSH